jgi:hypothetical protein
MPGLIEMFKHMFPCLQCSTAALALLIAMQLSSAAFRADRPVSLRELVPPGDPLRQHDLTFDPTFVQVALRYARSPDPALLEILARLPAAEHLLRHARQFDYEVPQDSTLSLVRKLLAPPQNLQLQVGTVERSLAFFTGPLIDNPQWVNDVLYYLPSEFRFHGSLFLTFGYDIGVALAPNASLNGANRHFERKPRELLYYAIHELHHVGVNTYQSPPRISDIRTCADVFRLVSYCTELEGFAVYAARARRASENALLSDPDYAALESADQMEILERRYFEQYRYLKNRGNQSVDDAAFAVIERMSSGDRLWYRVGALMARRIEERLGHAALVGLITEPHPALVETYQKIWKSPRSED